MTFISATSVLLRHTQQTRVLLIGSGRMGNIRAAAMYSNPRFDLCGVVDSNVDEASKLANTYHVRTRIIVLCSISLVFLYL